MKEMMLFTDGSVNTLSKVGVGAYLLINKAETDIEFIKTLVKTRSFYNTSSTKLELQTLLWALSEMEIENCKIIVYSDSQNILGLPGRQKRLEERKYLSNKNSLIQNHNLYNEFFQITNSLEIEFIKVKGHLASKNKSKIDQLFSIVDKAARKTLRNGNY